MKWSVSGQKGGLKDFSLYSTCLYLPHGQA